MHAEYACAHSGACCTAGWAIPVEAPKQPLLGSALLVPGDDGACRFFDRQTHLCAVQRDVGEPALPESCRHFPRVALRDDRGIHVTLSHFCPTAARLLFSTAPLAIVESPAAFPAARDYDGLDARGTWPPLVHDSLLFDVDSYAEWERFAVASFDRGPSAAALARLAAAAERLRRWTPADGAMAGVVARFDPTSPVEPDALARYEQLAARAHAIVADAIPDALRLDDARRPANNAGHDRAPGVADDRALSRYLAAKAFATWTAYQGRGVRTLVAELVLARALALALARTRPLVEAIREADRQLVHLADRPSLVAALAVVERR